MLRQIKYESVCFFVDWSNKKFNPKSLRCDEKSLKVYPNYLSLKKDESMFNSQILKV